MVEPFHSPRRAPLPRGTLPPLSEEREGEARWLTAATEVPKCAG